MRTTYDFAPLWRSTIGFDRLSTSSMPSAAADRHRGQLPALRATVLAPNSCITSQRRLRRGP